MSALHEQFALLSEHVNRMIGLLEEADERFWIPYFKRGLKQIDEHKLGGVTFVLGCYGGEDTFSDLVIGECWRTSDPLKYRNLNARLAQLRTAVFESANAITSRRAW